jgi:hypothetical protein
MGWDSFKNQVAKDNQPKMSDYDATRMKVQGEVKGLMNKLKFDSIVSSGATPVEAAKRVGIDIPFGKRMSTLEIQRAVQTGGIPKKRL